MKKNLILLHKITKEEQKIIRQILFLRKEEKNQKNRLLFLNWAKQKIQEKII